MTDALELKVAVASFWRYTRQCPLVAFEASGFACGQSDVLVVDQRGEIAEVEVKVSLADFRADADKPKHRNFQQGAGGYISYFYFAVPKGLANKVAYFCDQGYPYAGVLGCDGLDGAEVQVYRHPRRLNHERASFRTLAHLAKQQSGTLCRLGRDLAQARWQIKALKKEATTNGDLSS